MEKKTAKEALREKGKEVIEVSHEELREHWRYVGDDIYRDEDGVPFIERGTMNPDTVLLVRVEDPREDETPPGVAPCPKDFGPIHYPDGSELSGTVVREVGIITDAIKGDGEYYKVIQRINLDDQEKDAIRFTYYRRESEDERFHFGGQTSFITYVDDTLKLLEEAKEEKILEQESEQEYFRAFLRPESWGNSDE